MEYFSVVVALGYC